jgi:hypothetical protein
MEPIKITTQRANKLISNKKRRESRKNKGLYYFKEGQLRIGIDNTSGDCFVEEFKKLFQCLLWLDGFDREEC